MPVRIGAATPTLRLGGAAVSRVYQGTALVFGTASTGTPAAPPLTVSEVTTSSVRATWTAPADGGSAITQYRVGWTELGGAQRAWSNLYLPGTLTLALTNLAADTDYDIFVEALNANGTGIRSTVRTRTLVAPVSSSALPARVVEGYHTLYSGLRVRDAHPNYNLIHLSFLVGTASDPGALKPWPGFYEFNTINHTNLLADVQFLQAAGKKVVWSIGGWIDLPDTNSFGYVLQTTAHVDRFMATIVPLIDAYGVDGVGFDLEHPENLTLTAMLDATNRLRTRYGPNFIIQGAPFGLSNSSLYTLYRDWSLGLTPRPLISFQFYNKGAETSASIRSQAAAIITTYGLADSDFVFGWTVSDAPGGGAVTPAFCNDVWSAWRSSGTGTGGAREARGGMLWSIPHDQQDNPNWSWALNHGGTVLGTPAPSGPVVATPGTPTANAPTAITTSGFTFSWTAGLNTTDMQVQNRTGTGAFVTAATVPVATTSYTFTGLQAGTAYEARVVPLNGSTAGAASNVVTATTSGAAAAALYTQHWDETNGTGIAGWRAAALYDSTTGTNVTRATTLVRDTTRDVPGGSMAGSLKWTAGTAGSSGVELTGTVSGLPAGSTRTQKVRVYNGDTVARQMFTQWADFDSAGNYRSFQYIETTVPAGTWSTEIVLTAPLDALATQLRPVAGVVGATAGATFNVGYSILT